jgi:molybdopterin converting factor small subunit
MQFKGFGSVPQQKLIKDWLLPECQKHYTDEAYNVESLKTSINLWVGGFCQRKADKNDGVEARVTLSTGCFGMMCQIDPELEKLGEREFKSLLSRLKNDVDFYMEFIDRLYQKVKERVFAGDIEGLNILVKESRDYKDWLAENGVVATNIQLIDGWAHPLADSGEVNGEETINTWAFASLICATATGRLSEGNKEKAVSMLLSEGVLKMEGWEAQVRFCKEIDAMYLQLINDLHSKLEQKLDQAFS